MIRYLLVFCLFLCNFSKSLAQQVDTLPQSEPLSIDSMEPSIFNFFQRNEVLSIQIETDIDRFLANQAIDAYHPAILRFQGKDGTDIMLPMEIKARGKSRRQFCEFPPVKMRFFSSDLKDHQLAPYQKLKMVTHCRTAIGIREVVLKEYLVYQLLNLFTENCFRAQLLKVTYKDVRKRQEPFEEYAMILEDEDQLAKRLGGQLMQQRGALSKYVSQEELTFLALFQYMIGNTDWILDRQHNVKFVKCPALKKLRAVAYDFDVCGLVDAAYAIPASHLPIKSVQERLFIGACVAPEAFEKTLDLFRNREQEVYELIDQFELLPEQQRKQMRRYLNSFYKIIEEADFVEKELLRQCKG